MVDRNSGWDPVGDGKVKMFGYHYLSEPLNDTDNITLSSYLECNVDDVENSLTKLGYELEAPCGRQMCAMYTHKNGTQVSVSLSCGKEGEGIFTIRCELTPKTRRSWEQVAEKYREITGAIGSDEYREHGEAVYLAVKESPAVPDGEEFPGPLIPGVGLSKAISRLTRVMEAKREQSNNVGK